MGLYFIYKNNLFFLFFAKILIWLSLLIFISKNQNNKQIINKINNKKQKER